MPADLTGVTQIAIRAHDIERATTFYRDTLGLPLLMNAPNMAFLDCAGIRIYLDANPAPADSSSSSLIYFRTANIERTHESLKQQGETIHQPPHIIAQLP